MVRSKLESDMGNYLNIKIDEQGWYDNWIPDEPMMTWRRGAKQSVLDRVFFNFFPDNIKSVTDWKLNLSDHAVVIVDLGNTLNKYEVKQLILNKNYYNSKSSHKKLLTRLEKAMASILSHWNPHQKLEFMKCMIRSIYIEDTQKINKRKNFEREIMRKEFEYLNLKLELETNNDRREIIAYKLDILQGKLKIEQDKIAKEIAEKIKTKWYNEGERSTKYFLNQLKSRTRKQKILTLNDNGRKINNPEEIEKMYLNFIKIYILKRILKIIQTIQPVKKPCSA